MTRHVGLNETPVRWGILGFGDVVERKSGKAFSQAPGSRLVAVMARNPEKAAAYAARHGVVKWFSKAEDLIADDEVDAVYIATPPYLHAPQTIAIAERGKHILCEKPMAMNLSECDDMIRAAEENGVQLMIAYYRRRFPSVVKIKELLDSGAIGRPLKIRAEFAMFVPSLANGESIWRFDPEVSGGGALWDVGSHRIDLMIHLFGDVAEVCAFVENIEYDAPVDESSVLLLKFDNGAQGVVLIHWNMPIGCDEIAIGGTKGRILCDLSTGRVELVTESGSEEWLLPAPGVTHAGIVEDFVRAVHSGRENCLPGREGRKTNAVIEAADRSSRERKAIRL
jgi:predicted dehydrogenase